VITSAAAQPSPLGRRQYGFFITALNLIQEKQDRVGLARSSPWPVPLARPSPVEWNVVGTRSKAAQHAFVAVGGGRDDDPPRLKRDR
jgi:hypothetical protein